MIERIPYVAQKTRFVLSALTSDTLLTTLAYQFMHLEDEKLDQIIPRALRGKLSPVWGASPFAHEPQNLGEVVRFAELARGSSVSLPQPVQSLSIPEACSCSCAGQRGSFRGRNDQRGR